MDALLDAIEDKLPDKVEEIVASGTVNINHCDSDGYTPLILACTVGHHDIVDFLIDQNAEVDFTAPDGASALFCAVQEGHWEVVELLIDSDANVNLQTSGGATPLYIAAQEGFKSLVKKLLSHGAKPGVRAHGVSPLFISCQERHVSCVKELLKGKADPNQKNKSGGLPLIVSCFKGHTPVVKELVKSADLDVNKCAAGISALMTAAKMKKPDVIKELLKHKDLDINLRSKNQERNNAAHFAATAGAVDIMDQLKEAGIDMAKENSAGLTPADMIMMKHNIKYDGPKGSGAPASSGESKGDSEPSKKEKKRKKDKKSKKNKRKDSNKNEVDNDLIEKLFSKFDFNHDGVLDTPEFMSCLIQLGFKDLFPGDQFKHKVRECFKQYDKDGSGGITRAEFKTFYMWLQKEHGIKDGKTPRLKRKSSSKLKRQASVKEHHEAHASSDAHVDYYILNRDPKVDFGINFKVKNFGPQASKRHHLLKDNEEYLVVRNLRNLPDGSLGPATLQGIEEGDIILQVDRKLISTFADFASKTKKKSEIHVSILRLPDQGHGSGKRGGGWHKGNTSSFDANPLAARAGDGGFLPSIRR